MSERFYIISAGRVFVNSFFNYFSSFALENGKEKAGTYLFSQVVSNQVSSALRSLTSVFGMGTGNRWDLRVIGTGRYAQSISAFHISLLKACTLKTEQ